jgi:hypothetical protein
MGWVDQLNRWALKGIRRHAIESVESGGEGCTVKRGGGEQFIRWSDVQEIAVVKQPSLATGCFALTLRVLNSQLVIVDDTVPGFDKLCAELPTRLGGAVPYEKWSVELMAESRSAGQVIFRRAL